MQDSKDNQNPEESQNQEKSDPQQSQQKNMQQQTQYVPVYMAPSMNNMMPQYAMYQPGMNGYTPVQVVIAQPSYINPQMMYAPQFQGSLPFLNYGVVGDQQAQQEGQEEDVNCAQSNNSDNKNKQKDGQNKKDKSQTHIMINNTESQIEEQEGKQSEGGENDKMNESLTEKTKEYSQEQQVKSNIQPQQNQILQQQLQYDNNNNQNIQEGEQIQQQQQQQMLQQFEQQDQEQMVQEVEQEEEVFIEPVRYETLAFTNKWIYKYLKNSKIKELFLVPVYEEEQDILQVLDIFAFRDKNKEEFEMMTYNPQKIKKPQDETQIGLDKYLNRNKSLLQYVLNFYTVENLKELNMPDNLLNAVYTTVNFVQKQCGYNDKKRSFRFNLMSHSHYRILFLKINLRSIKELVKNQQDVQMHKECFNLDLPEVKQMYMDRNVDEGEVGGCDQYLELKKDLQYVNFVKMCINELLKLHIQDHILCDVNNVMKYINGEFEYEKRALNKIQQMIQGQYTNRF